MNNEVKTLLISGTVVLAILGILVGVSRYKDSTRPTPEQALLRSDSHSTGPTNAKVTVVEFGDFQCPSCKAFEPTFEQLKKDYDGKVRFVFRNFPLISIHPNAMAGAQAAEAANAQGKYWEMHDLLYAKQDEWAESSDALSLFKGYASSLKLDVNKFTSDIQSNAHGDFISQDLRDAETLNLAGTPTIFVNGTKLDGVPNYSMIKEKIDAGLK
jgi:protein-disulfide isomerase